MPRISDFQFLQRPAQPVLSVRGMVTVSDIPALIGTSFCRISSHIAGFGQLATDVPFVAFHNFEHIDEQHTDIEVGCTVACELPGNNEIAASVMPACRVAFCLYQGDNEAMIPLYHEMAEWIAKQGYEITGPAYEYYYNGEQYGKDKLLTKVVIPVKRKE